MRVLAGGSARACGGSDAPSQKQVHSSDGASRIVAAFVNGDASAERTRRNQPRAPRRRGGCRCCCIAAAGGTPSSRCTPRVGGEGTSLTPRTAASSSNGLPLLDKDADGSAITQAAVVMCGGARLPLGRGHAAVVNALRG